jgi:hypothetical protein
VHFQTAGEQVSRLGADGVPSQSFFFAQPTSMAVAS